jgi:hypothetical protein
VDRRRVRIVLGWLLVLVLASSAGTAGQRLCAGPVSFRGQGPPAIPTLTDAARVQPQFDTDSGFEHIVAPSWVDQQLPPRTAEDSALYQFHAVLAVVLERLRCSETASGVQWVKAAIHARSTDEVSRASQGIRHAWGRAGSAARQMEVAERLCQEASPRNWDDRDYVAVSFLWASIRCNDTM